MFAADLNGMVKRSDSVFMALMSKAWRTKPSVSIGLRISLFAVVKVSGSRGLLFSGVKASF